MYVRTSNLWHNERPCSSKQVGITKNCWHFLISKKISCTIPRRHMLIPYPVPKTPAAAKKCSNVEEHVEKAVAAPNKSIPKAKPNSENFARDSKWAKIVNNIRADMSQTPHTTIINAVWPVANPVFLSAKSFMKLKNIVPPPDQQKQDIENRIILVDWKIRRLLPNDRKWLDLDPCFLWVWCRITLGFRKSAPHNTNWSVTPALINMEPRHVKMCIIWAKNGGKTNKPIEQPIVTMQMAMLWYLSK